MSDDRDQHRASEEGSGYRGVDAPGPEPDTGVPGFGTALTALITGLALALLLSWATALVGASLTAAILLGELGFLVGVVLHLAARGFRVAEAMRLRAVRPAAYPLALQLGLALLLANFAASVLLGPPAQDVRFIAEAESALERAMLLFGVALAAPLIEEALFRGLLQGALERRVHHWLAIGVAGLAFAVLHGPAAAPFFVVWSLPVGWVTWRLASIAPAVVVHAVNNLVGVVGLLAAGVEPRDPAAPGSGVVAVAFAALGFSVIWAVRLCQRLGGLASRSGPFDRHDAETKPGART
ncbi:MAG: CPBP family intramembrane metalloprotease [Gemmatimonadota bacterium]|nr:MAG: CPBP family intramembrane metalloprotease [Gemmatimonadota bacterium]